MVTASGTFGGPIGNISDEGERHLAVRGLLLSVAPQALLQSGVVPVIVPSASELHAVQVVAWLLSVYGAGLPGFNWGSPAFPGKCEIGPSSRIYYDGEGMDICLANFQKSPPALVSLDERAGAAALFASCLAKPSFRAAANALDAQGVADSITSPPFADVLVSADVVDASQEIGAAVGDNFRLAHSGGTKPAPKPGGGIVVPKPGGVLPPNFLDGFNEAIYTKVLLVGVPLLGLAGLGAYLYTRKPRRLQNPNRRGAR